MEEFVLQNEKLRVTLLSYGAIIQKIEMPDKNGNWENIVLGFEKKEEYIEKNIPYLGAMVGRTAGRTKNGILKIGENMDIETVLIIIVVVVGVGLGIFVGGKFGKKVGNKMKDKIEDKWRK